MQEALQSERCLAQVARQAAEQKAQELSAQVDKLTEQAVEAAAEAQQTLESAMHKASREVEKAEVIHAVAVARLYLTQQHEQTPGQSSCFVSTSTVICQFKVMPFRAMNLFKC